MFRTHLPPLLQTFMEPDSFPSSFLPLSSFSGLVEMLPPGLSEVLKVSHQIKYSLLFSCEFFFSWYRVLSFFCSKPSSLLEAKGDKVAGKAPVTWPSHTVRASHTLSLSHCCNDPGLRLVGRSHTSGKQTHSKGQCR